MIRKLFWVALVAVVAAGVVYLRQRPPSAEVVVEDVPFVDSEDRTPTLAEMADRVFARYTEGKFISYDVKQRNYTHKYEVSGRLWAARGRFKSTIDVDTVTFLGTTSDLFTITLLLNDGMVHEEWFVAKDGSHAATTYPPDRPNGPRWLALGDNMDGHVCGMAGGLGSTPIGHYQSIVFNAHRRFIGEGKLLGTCVFDGRRCAVVEYHVPNDPGHYYVLAVNPDYFVVRDTWYENWKPHRTISWHNISTEPIPDDVWKCVETAFARDRANSGRVQTDSQNAS